MTIINLKDMYSDYYIRQWKKEGLPLITERPPTTTQEILNNFFNGRIICKKNNKKKAIAQTYKKMTNKAKKIDWRDYIKEEYK